MDERKKTAISNEEGCHEGEVTMEHKREETNGKQTENVIETDCPSIARERTKEKDDRMSGAVCYDDEIMMEFKQVETNEAAAAKTLESNEEISKEDVEIRRIIEERRTSPKEEKQRLTKWANTSKMYQGQGKSEKTVRNSTNIRRLQRD